MTAALPRIDSYGPADSEGHGSLAFIEQCGLYSAYLRAQHRRWWQSAMQGKARFKTCQFIEGEPSTDDACKCGAQAVNGVYCGPHLERCAGASRKPSPKPAVAA